MNYLALFFILLFCDNYIFGLANDDLTDAPIIDIIKADYEVTDCQIFAEDCFNVQQKGYKSGVYQVRPLGAPKPYLVYCDVDTHDGDWTILQHRFDGKVDFYRNFSEYTKGFGEITGEHWAGLETMHQLTSRRQYELYIELEDFEKNKTFANYKKFSIDSKEEGYKLNIGEYSGTAGDSLSGHNGKKFTTFDVDNDAYEGNCAVLYKGAWWYHVCHASNLNGHYSAGVTKEYAIGVVWNAFRGFHYSLKITKMMIRPLIRTKSNNEEIHTLTKQVKEMREEIVALRKQLNQPAPTEVTPVYSGEYPEDCAYVAGNISGVYRIKPTTSKESYNVYCDLNFQGLKWTVIQNRFNGTVDFYQTYKDYQNGFGDLGGEHWLGLEKIHRIVHSADYELLVILTDRENVTKIAKYKKFSLCGAHDGYRLKAEGFIGEAGDSLGGHNGHKFTTFDKDEDANPSNCAVSYSGAWWYNNCHSSNLNGLYDGAGPSGMVWHSFHGDHKTLKSSKMLVRKKYPDPMPLGCL